MSFNVTLKHFASPCVWMVPCRLNFPLCTLFFNGGTFFGEGINLIFSNGVLRDSFLIRSSVTTIVFFSASTSLQSVTEIGRWWWWWWWWWTRDRSGTAAGPHASQAQPRAHWLKRERERERERERGPSPVLLHMSREQPVMTDRQPLRRLTDCDTWTTTEPGEGEPTVRRGRRRWRWWWRRWWWRSGGCPEKKKIKKKKKRGKRRRGGGGKRSRAEQSGGTQPAGRDTEPRPPGVRGGGREISAATVTSHPRLRDDKGGWRCVPIV